MAIPALRQPKIVLGLDRIEKPLKNVSHIKNYVIITLKSDKKLVVTVDSYNGIISTGGSLKCVFCGVLITLDQTAKEKHIHTNNHNKNLDDYPHLEEFSYNLIRKLDDVNTYCTMCNVVVENVKLMKHVCSEHHLQELERATARAHTYKPFQCPLE